MGNFSKSNMLSSLTKAEPMANMMEIITSIDFQAEGRQSRQSFKLDRASRILV